MVNDQLIRIHQLKQVLALENSSPKVHKLDEEAQAQDLAGSQNFSTNESPPTECFSKNEHKQPHPAIEQTHPTSPTIDGQVSESLSSPGRNKENISNVNFSPKSLRPRDKAPLKKQSSNSSSGGSNQSSKRRSAWRNLLTPSYKSRSDEFHKIFCDKIPKNERLIADYACALHREILIQGRVYISVNYVAFYSNLFSWITKLVVRLRDISEIYKANTARIIPNAIQIVMTSGEKHVFASFVARDKSYVMMLRIWRNNLMNECMTDQEIRNLVYFSYGKDLGMGDNEELKINSPDPITPANVPLPNEGELQDAADKSREQERLIDGNNNSCRKASKTITDSENEPQEMRRSKSSPIQQVTKQQLDLPERIAHTRYNSYDFINRIHSLDQTHVFEEVASKLNELSKVYKGQDDEQIDDGAQSPGASSTVILDTPILLAGQTPRSTKKSISLGEDGCGQQFKNEHEPSSTSLKDSTYLLKMTPDGGIRQAEDGTNKTDDSFFLKNESEPVSSTKQTNFDNEELVDLTTHCGCDEHRGQLIADQEFDVNIDTLFTLIFTNSKFMRTYMIRRGMRDTNISGWKRSNNGDGKSNSSTPSIDGRQEGNSCDVTAQLVRIKQVRQLNYSMNLDHMWAKQVQVEERQNICQVKPGVYVLKSQTLNSGIPYGETFTVDMTYCLTRSGEINKSRMLIHSFVNFDKEKQNWKLAMVKSMIEHQSIQGVKDFINDLTSCIKDYINQAAERSQAYDDIKRSVGIKDESYNGGGADGERSSGQQSEQGASGNNSTAGTMCQQSGGSRRPSVSHQQQQPQQPNGSGHNRSQIYRHGGSLVRAKSKLKERKLRSMYRYYIRNEHDIEGGASFERGPLATNNNSGSGHQSSTNDALSDDSASLSSFNDIDENGSMMMMMHATDDQLSDTASMSFDEEWEAIGGQEQQTAQQQPQQQQPSHRQRRPQRCPARCMAGRQADEENGSTSMDKSFSDVDTSKNCSCNKRPRSHQRTTGRGSGSREDNSKSGLYSLANRSTRSPGPGAPGRPITGGLLEARRTPGLQQLTAQQQQQSQPQPQQRPQSRFWFGRTKGDALVRVFDGGTISERNWAALAVVTLLIMLFVVIVSHVLLLKRLDSLEQRLVRLQCKQILTPAEITKGN